jgi:glycosyltransferase involved in cell wall biosynthesis
MVLDNLATRMTARGETVVVVAPRARTPCDDATFPYRVCRFRKPVSKRFGLRLLLPRLAAMHRKHRFDVVHCHSGYPASYVAAAFKNWCGVPFVVRPHGTDILPGRRIRSHAGIESRLKRSLAAADAVIAQGRFLKGVLLELGLDKRRVHTIHNGVDLAAFRQFEKFPHPQPYVLAMGTLKDLKGFDILLRAYARLENPRCDLLIGGSGPERDNLHRLAGELKIAKRVRFVGFVESQRKIDLYRSAEFFVCPSRIESFANVILEALAAGLPIVASDVGGNSELVRNDCHGLLFPSEDPAALAAVLERLLHNADLLAHFRAAVPQFIAAFDWQAVVERYLDLYRAVVDPQPTRCGGFAA